MRRAVFVGLVVLIQGGTSTVWGEDVTVWLQDKATGLDTVNLDVSQTAVVQLWVDVPAGVILISMDAVLTGYDASSGKNLGFEVSAFNDITITNSLMQRANRGAANIEDDLPNAFIDDYQYNGEDPNIPWDGTSGLQGPRTVLLDEIVIHGTQSNAGNGPDQIIFGQGLQAPGGFEEIFVSIPPPGSWQLSQLPPFAQGTGSLGSPLFVNVTPEPTSLVLLGIGMLAVVRRRR